MGSPHEGGRKISLALTIAIDGERCGKLLAQTVVCEIMLKSKFHFETRRRYIFIKKLSESIIPFQAITRRGIVHYYPTRKTALVAIAVHLHAQLVTLGLVPREVNLAAQLLDVRRCNGEELSTAPRDGEPLTTNESSRRTSPFCAFTEQKYGEHRASPAATSISTRKIRIK